MRLKHFACLALCGFLAAPSFGQALNPFLAGMNAVVPEHPLEHNGVANGSNWEAYCDAFGDGTLALASIREEITDLPSTERTFVAFYHPNNTLTIHDGFYTETGFPNQAWDGNNDTVRQNGNPARIGCDRRPGGTRYMIGNEATPWSFPGLFPNFSPGMLYTAQMAVVQLFDKPTAGTIVPLALAEDPKFVPGDTGPQNDQDRFGGDIRGLSNGHFVVQVDARSTAHSPTLDRWLAVTIYDETGARVTGPFNANQVNPTDRTDGWSNLAAYDGGWANFPEAGGININGNRTIQFWGNDGSPQGTWEHIRRTDANDPLAPAGGFSTSIDNPGGSNRINSHPSLDQIFYFGRGVGAGGANTGVYITQIDVATQMTVKEVMVNDTFVSQVERVFGHVNGNGEIVVTWSTGPGDAFPNQMLTRVYNEDLDPVTEAFFSFENSNVANFTARRPSCAIVDDGRILVSGRFEGTGATGIPQYAGSFAHDQVAIVLQGAQPGSSVDNWDLHD